MADMFLRLRQFENNFLVFSRTKEGFKQPGIKS